MRYLLDTNVLSEPLRSQPDEAVLEQLQHARGEVAISAVTLHEMVYGFQRLPRSRRRRRIARYVLDVVAATLPVLPYDSDAASWHGRERARLALLGRTPPFADGQIAAIAATRDLRLVTRNVPDFHHFDGLRVERWHQG